MKLFFNKRLFEFDINLIKKIYSLIIENEKSPNSDKLYGISFVSDFKIIYKSYAELEFHEFLLVYNIDIPYLICNICNVMGKAKAELYISALSRCINQEITLLTKTTSVSLSLTDATRIASDIFDTETLEKFKIVLGIISLYLYAKEDYEQLIEDVNIFSKVDCINGISFQKIFHPKGFLILKPIYSLYDCPISEYKNLSRILIPPCILNSTFKTLHHANLPKINVEDGIWTKLFLLKYQQLTGHDIGNEFLRHLKSLKGENNKLLIGKWFSISRMRFSLCCLSIKWYQENGNYKESSIFVNESQLKLYLSNCENWRDLDQTWKTRNNSILIQAKNSRDISEFSYKIENNQLLINGTIYYRTLTEALENISD